MTIKFSNSKVILIVGITASLCSPFAIGQQSDDGKRSESSADEVSPILKINQPRNRDQGRVKRSANSDDLIRSIDGSDNNQNDPSMGSAYSQLVRLLFPEYSDGISSLAGGERNSAREISNIVSAQSQPIPNSLRASDYLWQWGQFVDHDIDLTDGADPAEPEYIEVPASDSYFNPGYTMAFNRSIYDTETGFSTPRQQLNEITAWIDASNVYGSEHERADALRLFDGTGQLKTSTGNLLPFNEEGLANAGGDSATLFLAGDVRANEQAGLTVMHTLFMREHNRLASQLAQENPQWSGDQIYEKARQLVGAQMQVITYREYLPALLGPNALRPYRGYDPDVNAGIVNSFSAAAYRYGHSALSPTLLRLEADGSEISYGHLALRNAFFSPTVLTTEGGIEPLLRGLANQECQNIDAYVIDDVRNFLFGAPPSNGFDLAALNIQRGRDHGLPSYNQARQQLGLEVATDFSDISSDPEVQSRLSLAYESVDDVDLWVGGLSEDALPQGHLGELFFYLVRDQFEALRDGDRFWYSQTLNKREKEMIEATRLSDIIRRNTAIDNELQNNVFYVWSESRGREGNKQRTNEQEKRGRRN